VGKGERFGKYKGIGRGLQRKIGSRSEMTSRRKKAKREEYRRMELPGKYTVKLLYGWDDRKFEEEYLTKLEKNWKRWKENR